LERPVENTTPKENRMICGQREKHKLGSQNRLLVPDVFDRAPLFIIEMPDKATPQSIQSVSPDVELESDPAVDHTYAPINMLMAPPYTCAANVYQKA
jgi:hypothetical protein